MSNSYFVVNCDAIFKARIKEVSQARGISQQKLLHMAVNKELDANAIAIVPKTQIVRLTPIAFALRFQHVVQGRSLETLTEVDVAYIVGTKNSVAR